MKKLLVLVILVAAGAWWITAPQGLPDSAVPDHAPDLANGERVFNAGGCASCHGQVVEGRPQRAVMAGGLEMSTPAGLFRAPNISPDPDHGIGRWSALEFLNAMQRGVSPEGRHYYPAFPYTSYSRTSATDLLDLKGYLSSLPASDNDVGPHELAFPYSLSRGLGLWKRLYLNDEPQVTLTGYSEQLARGQYLVEGPTHCGECHTPRNFAQAMDTSRWLSGAAYAGGEGRVPGIDLGRSSFAAWSKDDIAYYLETGVDPDFDVVGGSMASVVDNLSRLPVEDREAIAAYLKALPAPE
ncbi:MAG: c-type cytochrome [Pseudomonadota bacterium]